MSDYTVLHQVNEGLRQLLLSGMTDDAALIINSINVIHVGSPKETAEANSTTQPKRLSLFLYQITEDPFMKNRPEQRSNGVTQQRVPPMALRFHYLITPYADNAHANALILGKVLETLYDNSTLTIEDPLTQQTEEIRVIFETLSLPELAEVWEALKEPYRLSLAYQVRVPRLESRRQLAAVPVGEAEAAYGNVP
ncbi:MAG: DUF4255 domain-containing protein [Gemmatimonadota bacterium]